MESTVKKENKQQWEYTVIYCTELEIEFDENKEQVTTTYPDLKEKAKNPIPLDPAIDIPASQKVYWKMAKSDISQRWMGVSNALNEYARKGWRMAGITPPWRAGSTSVGPHLFPTATDFYIILERRI